MVTKSGSRIGSQSTSRRGMAIAIAALLVAAGCGQRSGVYDPMAVPDALGLPPAASGSVVIDTETGEVVPAGSLEGTETYARPGTTSTTASSASEGTTAAGEVGDSGPLGATRVGVTDSTIKIGVHAPLTGAAPVPARSMDQGKDLYFRWMELNGQTIHGRRVEVVMKNDDFNTSRAVAMCKELIEKDKVFLIFGFAGPDQMTACARYSSSVGVPYVSLSNHRLPVENLAGYLSFALSFTDQMPYLARLLAREGGRSERNGAVRFNTASGVHSTERMRMEMAKLGMVFHHESTIAKNASPAEFTSVVQGLKEAGIQNVMANVSPAQMISLIHSANSQGYNPRWIGAGLTTTLDLVPELACDSGKSLHNALYFSYTPAFSDANSFDPDFERALAMQKESDATTNPDEFHWIGWSFNRTLAHAIELVGRDLTRERFVSTVSRSRFDPPIFHPIDFRRDGRFGGTDMYLLRADCNDRRWETERESVRNL